MDPCELRAGEGVDIKQSNSFPSLGQPQIPNTLGNTCLSFPIKNYACFVEGPGLAELLDDHVSQARIDSTILFHFYLHSHLGRGRAEEQKGRWQFAVLTVAVSPFPSWLVNNIKYFLVVWG